MELNDFFSLIKRKKQTIISLVIAFLVIALVLTAVQPFKYSSELRLLVVQGSSQTSPDPYAAARSNEYLSGILAKITYSGSFYNRVINASFNIDKDYFGQTAKKQSKKWNKTISAKAISDTGIISLAAYHKDRQQAEQIARAVGHVLMTQHINYHGMNNVKIKLLDEPITSNYPVKPNVALNLILGLFLGFIFSLSYIYLFPDRKDIRFFSRKKERMIYDWIPDPVDDTIEQAMPAEEPIAPDWLVAEQEPEKTCFDYPEPEIGPLNLDSPMEEPEQTDIVDDLFGRPEERPSEDQLFR
ncbi:MAG: Wzz/FepE/Etk N-terminal domain-containing protein [bacterium]